MNNLITDLNDRRRILGSAPDGEEQPGAQERDDVV